MREAGALAPGDERALAEQVRRDALRARGCWTRHPVQYGHLNELREHGWLGPPAHRAKLKKLRLTVVDDLMAHMRR